MSICYKINDTQTECCNPLTDACSIRGEGPLPQGPVGLAALGDLVDVVSKAFQNLLSGKKENSTTKEISRREQPFLGDGCWLGENKILYCKARP